ncbi:hypothetical protein BU204_23470 [Actinophytocola xanthii]|uniref:FHA domain-containing protein n=2 Tax=Actinophytocola xanthii TaxID=1912961 RepID=A0A1Q8CLA1_9PSEU|nr:hypothetical protein BU204_23470 [Actinophytocola xanthii]
MSVHGGFRMARREGATLLFGRHVSNVQVAFGVDDRRVSRLQGEVVCRDGQWWLRNRGRNPIRADSRFLLPGDEWGPLPIGPAQVFVTGEEGRQHMLALHVASQGDYRRHLDPDHATSPPRAWPLDQKERLVLVVVFQRYLRGDVLPRPLPRRRAAEQLMALDATGEWTPKQVEHVMSALRERLSSAGVYGLTLEDAETLSPDRLQHNLITELMSSATLRRTDLWLLERTE